MNSLGNSPSSKLTTWDTTAAGRVICHNSKDKCIKDIFI